MKHSPIQFSPSDYLRDTRTLSLAAKGGWMDMLCALHSAATRGRMTLPVLSWSRIMAATVEQAEAVLVELERMGVGDITREMNGDVTVCSRRMVREGLMDAAEAKPVRKKPAVIDADWLASLKFDPAYAGIDVDRESAKCSRWCEENRQAYSRRRLVNWLNRCERPMKGQLFQIPVRLGENIR